MRIQPWLVWAMICTIHLQAMPLKDIISQALGANPSLASIHERLAADISMTAISSNFPNPELSYAGNTLDSSEPMSRQTLSVKQKIPFYGKRDADRKIARTGEEVSQEQLKMAQVELVYAIKDQAYRIWLMQENYKIIHAYIDLTRHNIELFESYTSTSDNQHMGIMSAELTRSDLRIQESRLKADIASAYTRLSYLASFEIEQVDVELAVWDLPDRQMLQEGLGSNPRIKLQQKKIDRQEAKLSRVELDNYPDIALTAGYSYRENFDDYWSMGIGISLPIYGKEDQIEASARKEVLSSEHLKEDIYMDVRMQMKAAYAKMQSAYEIYHIIEDESLPQIEHMFELTSSSIATGGDLFKYIDLLVQKLKLEQKRINAIVDYSRADAQIAALSGEME